jgi:fatty acid-binding protein DegV
MPCATVFLAANVVAKRWNCKKLIIPVAVKCAKLKSAEILVLTLTAGISVTKHYNITAYLGWRRGNMSRCDTMSVELPIACLVHVWERFCANG